MYQHVPSEIVNTCFGICFLVSIWIHFRLRQYNYRWVFGVTTSLCLFVAGWAIHDYQDELHRENHYSHVKNAQYVIIVVDAEPIEKPSVYKLAGKAIAVVDSTGTSQETSGKLLVYAAKKQISRIPVYGDVLVIPASAIVPVKPPANPDEFNFKQYLALKQVYFQAYLNSSELLFTGENQGIFIFRWVYATQLYMKNVLTSTIGSQNETGVAEALLYGYDKDINDETKQAYSNTGTLHVLAVSGMHVGIIYMILGLVLVPLNKLKKGKLISQLIILLCLWAYSFICGLSPSILRATVMFSFIIAAGLMKQQSVVYNTLAASVFVLLCFDPNLVVNVGFQLSYLAVLGILIFQPYISSWYTAPNWLMHQIWSVTAVSLAAQLITFPIGLFYFHQFPNCFLLSNMLMIPLTTLILYIGMLLLSVSWFPWLAAVLGKVLYYVIWFTNEVVKWIEQIPYAYVNGIRVNMMQSFLLYLIIVLFTFFLIRNEKIWLKLALRCMLVFSGMVVYTDIGSRTQARMVVYHIPKYNAVQCIVGNHSLLIADSALASDNNKMKFHLQPHTWKSGIEDQQIVYTDPTGWQRITIGDKHILVAGKGNIRPDTCDILIVKSKQDPLALFTSVKAGQVILTSSVRPADAIALIAAGRQQKIDVKYVGDTGAIQLSLLNK
jgi:competence protein ComEC